MSADVRIIIGHNLTAKEVIHFPEKLDQAQELKDCFLTNIKSKLDHNYSREDLVDKLQKRSTLELG